MKSTTQQRKTRIEVGDIIDIRPEPDNYILDEPLGRAVEVALRFNQPLLLTGEPGTGKTLLAEKVAAMLSQQSQAENTAYQFSAKPLRFNTKTTSTARDLFYIYDAIGHFQNANIQKITDNAKEQLEETFRPKHLKEFIELQALGKAIAFANPENKYKPLFKTALPKKAQSSVVLIDEIDKAPRDFTNDILNEIERQEFFIKEQNNERLELGKDNPQRILIIMTSNSEKNLPEAFLRRCVFHHIKFPSSERLQDILKAQLSKETKITKALKVNLEEISNLFIKIRDKATARKPPATAELVAFTRILEMDGHLAKENPDIKKWFENNLYLLAKTKDDIKSISDYLTKL